MSTQQPIPLIPMPQPQKNYCRICLQQTQPLKKLPCNCKGSLSYMHDTCLNQMIHIKIQTQKQDVPDYIQPFDKNSSQVQTIKAKCQICLHQITLQKQCKIKLQKLIHISLQVYLVLFGIGCVSFFGLNIAYTLFKKAMEQTGVIIRGLYFGAYVWIIGVILFVMFQPLYSEVKTFTFKIVVTTDGGSNSVYGGKGQKIMESKWRRYFIKLMEMGRVCKNTFKKYIGYKFDNPQHTNCHGLRNSNKFIRKYRSKSRPKYQQKQQQIRYFQI